MTRKNTTPVHANSQIVLDSTFAEQVNKELGVINAIAKDGKLKITAYDPSQNGVADGPGGCHFGHDNISEMNVNSLNCHNFCRNVVRRYQTVTDIVRPTTMSSPASRPESAPYAVVFGWTLLTILFVSMIYLTTVDRDTEFKWITPEIIDYRNQSLSIVITPVSALGSSPPSFPAPQGDEVWSG
jgi:hypothetical protein